MTSKASRAKPLRDRYSEPAYNPSVAKLCKPTHVQDFVDYVKGAMLGRIL